MPSFLLNPVFQVLDFDAIVHLLAQIMKSKGPHLYQHAGPQQKPEPHCIHLPFGLGEAKGLELGAVSRDAI